VAAKHGNSEVIISRDCNLVACDAVYVCGVTKYLLLLTPNLTSPNS
jgi:hypothetical protein